MDSRPLDITVISASGLDNFLLVFKMKVYVVVSLINGKSVIEKKTHMSNGRNPRWNHRIKFPVEESAIQTSTLLFVLRQHRMLGDKDIGEVSIPVRELLETNSGYGSTEHEVDYQVQSTRGKCKGTFTFSHEFREKVLPVRADGGSHPVPVPGTTYMVNQQGMPAYPQQPYSTTPPGYVNYPCGPAPPQYGGTWYPPPGTTPPGTYPYPPPPQMGYNQHLQQGP
ncbi:protein SRC2 homolog [Lactuca sativa]|uniref:protein SRC2 homolog n=1 Tax=Lactuca sativa TaxID=4236 RepID=UPI000CBE2D90|nr:protein SRC2 homolog [Lactuca sativa]